jgi:putative oxidoreductase
MERVLGRFSPYLYAVLRIVAGLLFAAHGAQKVLGVFGGQQLPVLSQFWIAGAIELVGGILIAIGLLTGVAAFVCSGEMAAAYFMAHAPRGPNPVQNGGELSVIYSFLFLYVASRGAGVWGLDRGGRRG